MTDYDMILHDMVKTRGAESVVKQLLEGNLTLNDECVECQFLSQEVVTDNQIRFEASRAAYKIAQRNKR